MIRRQIILTAALAVLFTAAAPVLAQSPLQVTVTTSGNPVNVNPNETVAVTATGVGLPVTSTVTIRYTGGASAIITGISVVGTQAIGVAGIAFPLTLNAGASASFTLQYLPPNGNSVNGLVTIAFTENGQPSTFPFNVTGTSPDLAFTFFFAPNGTLANLTPGQQITFGATNVGSSSSAVINVLNRGSAPGSLVSVTASGADFQVTGSPAPASVPAGQQVSFTLVYTPHAAGTSSGLLNVGLPGTTDTFLLSGLGATNSLSVLYHFPDNNQHTLADGGTVSFPSVDVNATTNAAFDILNQGNGTATVNAVTLTGAGFQLSGVPPLPSTVTSTQDFRFTVLFSPTQPGTYTGTLRIDFNGTSVTATLTASTNSSNFAVSYSLADGNVHSLSDGAVISFPSVDVNGITTASVTIVNQGTGAGTVTGISVSGAGFQLTGSPVFPATIPAGQSLKFGIVFAPTTQGSFNGTFQISLSGRTISGTLSGSTSTPTFALSYVLSDGTVHPLTDGAIIAFPSVDVNGNTTASITVLNQGPGSGAITGITVAGGGFQVTGAPAALPSTLASGASVRFNFVFNPVQAGSFTGTFQISVTGHTYSGTLTGSTSTSSFAVSYTLADGVVRSLVDGGTIAFPSVDINGNSTAAVTILNQGAGTGTITNISVAGAGFLVTGSPILPATVGPNQSVRFNFVFSPTQAGSFSGTFQITVTGHTYTGTLTGSTSTPSFTVSYTLSDGVVHALADGAAIAFPPVDVNVTSTATVTILNQGAGTGSLTAVSVSGAGFLITGSPLLPATIAPNQSVHFNFVFNPTQAGSFSGTFQISITGHTYSGTLTASTAAPTFTLSYIDPNTSNVLPLANNATLTFPSTLTGSTSTITVQAANTGAGTGSVTSVTLAGGASSAFQLVNLPPLPVSVPPAQQTRFGIRFSPQQQQNATDVLTVVFNNLTITVNLQAQGTQPQYTYASAGASGTVTFAPGGTLAVADTVVGQTTSVTISITNNGTGDGQIAAIGVTGTGLSVSDLPAVPLTLHPSGSQHFTLNFTPTQPGAVSGRLAIGSDTFTVTGTGIGSRLIFTYTSGSSAVPVVDTGSVLFPPLAVGSSENLTFAIQNTGTSSAVISSVNLSAPSTIFALAQVPALPMNLDPGASVAFSVSFAPNNTGSLTATLRVNNSSFVLTGNGTQPTALPSYSFQGPNGNQQPAQQPAVGLTLSAPYPLALQGTLKLSFVSAVFADDSSIQFASGGRTVNFTIPANTTQAMFNGTATSISLQTGTTAGDIVLTPSFAMQSGGFDLTPSSPNALTLTIPRSAPQLTNASISAVTTTSFTVTLSGYSTSRALRQLAIQITPKSGQNFSTTNLTIDVSSASASWFQSTAAQGFGGSFLMAIPFVLSNGSTTSDLVHMLQSLSITAANDVGTSSAMSVTIP